MIKHLSTQGKLDPKGGFPFFVVSKENLNPSYWCICCIKNHQKWNKIENVMAPQSKKGQEFKKQTTTCYKGRFPKHQKISFYVVIKIQKWFVELQAVLL